MQKLILPIDRMRITANYKNTKYKAAFGFAHYGMDCVSAAGNTAVRALGAGEVIACGQDGATLTGANSRLGNCIVIVYRDVLCNDGKTRNLACRMFHFDSIAVKSGQKVDADTIIGRYGNTGANTTGAHLHIEFDSDIAYPQYAVGIKASGNIIKRGTVDSTVNPSAVWHKGAGQSVTGTGDGWYSASDLAVPPIADEELDEAKKEIARLEKAVAEYETERASIRKKLEELLAIVK